MNLIIAYILPDKLPEVKKIFHENDCLKYSVMDAFGHREQDTFQESYRGIAVEVDLIPKIRIEVAVKKENVEKVVKSILEGGKSGRLGAGKIFVLPIESSYSIHTGEKTS
jgi:nitrogen regulatory protein P-II 2